MKGALVEKRGRGDKNQRRWKHIHKGHEGKGGGNQSQEQTRSKGSIPETAAFPWEKKAAGWRGSTAPCCEERCSPHPLHSESWSFSIATRYLKANLETEDRLKNKTQHVSIYYLYFKPQLGSTQDSICLAWGSIFMESSLLPSYLPASEAALGMRQTVALYTSPALS